MSSSVTSSRALASSEDRETWLAVRRQYVTASEADTVVYGYGTEAYRQLVKAKRTGEARDIGHLRAVAAGRHLERGILDWWLETRPQLSVVHNTELHTHELYPRVAATADAYGVATVTPPFSLTRFVVEVKNTGPMDWGAGFKRWRARIAPWVEDDRPPRKYVSQVQTQILVHDVPYGYLVGCFGGNLLHEVCIMRNVAWEATLMDAVERFWDEVEHGI